MDNTVEFVHNLIEGNFVIGNYLKQISKYITVKHCDINILNNVHIFLNVRTSVFVNQNGQKMLSLTFGDLLLEMCKEHYHSKNGCKCKYHEESLIEHSIYAMLKCIEIMPLSINLNERTRIAITALFHDIGKITAYIAIKKTTDGIISFPFHGEYGCGIMMKMWTIDNPYFNKEQWENLCRTIAVHMCGYHSTDYNDCNTKYKMQLLHFENDNVKETLHWLCYGDKSGKVSPYVDNNIIDLLRMFKINVYNDFNLRKFYRNNGYTGFLIKLCGRSGVGKSTFAKLLIEMFINKGVKKSMIVYIERDLIMCNVALSHQNKELINEKPSSEIYNECYKYYKTNKLETVVNDIISNNISFNKNKIIIVDTLMNLHTSANQIYPSCCKSMFRININIIRNTLVDMHTCSRMNMTMEEQLSLLGEVNTVQWLPKDVNLHNLTAITTNKIITSHVIQPIMCFQVTWNNEILGMNEITRIVEEISQIANSNLNILDFLKTFENADEIKKYMDNNAVLMTYPQISKNHKCFLLKYMNHNKNFHETWMRQVRGTVFLKVDDEYVCIKNLLQKGMEYLTIMHHNNGIIQNETSFGTYDDIQIDIINKFKNKESLQSTLSFKSDGSLFGVILIPRSNEKLSNIIIDMCNQCPIAKLLLNKSIAYGFVPMICSSGTLIVDISKIGYYVTSILCGMLNFDYDELCALAQNKTEIEVFEQYIINEFLIRINTFWVLSEHFQENIMCLSFEAVCKNRKCAWNNFHSELAVSYDHCSLKFLGCTYNVGKTMGNYRAHFQLGNIPNECGFIEPLFWHCEHTSDIANITEHISDVLQTRMTIEEFYIQHPYNNQYSNIEQDLDYEGFVIYVKVNDNVIGTQINDYDVDYGKAKTIEYYECHKMSIKNACDLNKYNNNVSIHMPIINNIKKFHEHSQVYVKNIVENVNILLTECCDKVHELYKYQQLLSTKNKMMLSFDKMNDKNTKCKMIINAFENFNLYYYNIICEYIPIEQNDIQFWCKILNKINWNDINCEPIYNDEIIMSSLFNAMNK